MFNSGFYRIQGGLGDANTLYDSSDCLLDFNCIRTNNFEIKGGKSLGLLRIPSPWTLKNEKLLTEVNLT